MGVRGKLLLTMTSGRSQSEQQTSTVGTRRPLQEEPPVARLPAASPALRLRESKGAGGGREGAHQNAGFPAGIGRAKATLTSPDDDEKRLPGHRKGKDKSTFNARK